MAQIREELILIDKFTSAFTSYLRQTGRAAQATELAKRTAQEYQQTQKNLGNSTDALTGKIKNLVSAYVGLRGVQSLVNLADTYAQTNARLDMMNDGLQTTAELNQMIYQSAQRSRGAYQGTADMVAKLGTLAGDAFGSSAEIVAFAEQLNKQMTLSGASSVGRDAAMLQLTQAMSSGVLRGEELNSILEQTPTIAQSIAKYMGVNIGTMRELASEGAITADVVKNALFAAAEETDAKFEQMPMTWSQVWTSMQNTAIMALQPVLNAINWAANNLDILIPIVATAGAAFAVFMLAANWVNICTSATTILTNAQKMLSAVMATGWGIPLLIIVAVIGAVYLLVAAFNKLTGSSVSATGIIAGTFYTLLAFLFNTVLVPIQNKFAAFANFLANLFVDPVTAIKVLFYDMAISVMGFIQSIAGGIESLINAIPGVEVDLTSKIGSIYDGLKANREAAIASGSYKEYVKAWDYMDLGEAYSKGYNWGSNLFAGSNFLSGVGAHDADSFGVPTYDQMAGISDSVGNIEKTVAMSQEDIKSLVDVAERRYVNNINLTSQTPVINVTGQNTGNTAADRQNLANALRDILLEQVASGTTRATGRAY